MIGIGKDYACLAAGRDALATLKRAIEDSVGAGAKAVPPLEASLAVKPVAAFAATVGKPQDRPKAAFIDSELNKTPGKDHVCLEVRPISDGVQIHLEIEQGLVRRSAVLRSWALSTGTRPAPAP